MVFSVVFLGLRGGLKMASVRLKTLPGAFKTPQDPENRGPEPPQNLYFLGLNIESENSSVFDCKINDFCIDFLI